jgi:hypothetical protein
MALSPATLQRLDELAMDAAQDMDDATRAPYALRFIEQNALGVAQLDAYIAAQVFERLCAGAEDCKADARVAA